MSNKAKILSPVGYYDSLKAAIDAKADFVKTSTGFSKSGATLTAVKIMRKTVKDILKIKASGGIRDTETAMKYIEVGVDRIGTSSGVAMMTNQTSLLEY